MFDQGNAFYSASQFIDEATLRNHFAAGLNGINGGVITTLLDALINGQLNQLTQDNTMKELWKAANWKDEHLIPGAIAIVATGRGYGIAKQSKLPISQGKVCADAAMAVKAYIWNTIGNGKRHLNEVEITAIKAANVQADNKPEIVETSSAAKVDSHPNKAKKSRNRKAKAETVELQQAA
jgi:hypothetical protein